MARPFTTLSIGFGRCSSNKYEINIEAIAKPIINNNSSNMIQPLLTD